MDLSEDFKFSRTNCVKAIAAVILLCLLALDVYCIISVYSDLTPANSTPVSLTIFNNTKENGTVSHLEGFGFIKAVK